MRRGPSGLLAAAAMLAVACGGAVADDPGAGAASAWSTRDLELDGDGMRVPTPEVSGLALRAKGEGLEILALGDRAFEIVLGDVGRDGRPKHSSFRAVDVRDLLREEGVELADVSQWEGLTTDGDGRVVILEENPGRLFVLDGDLSALEHTVELSVRRGDGEVAEALRDDWKADANSRAEGLVLLPGGHVLVAKEKAPRLLVEFGPRGEAPTGFRGDDLTRAASQAFRPTAETFVPLFAWQLGDRAKAEVDDLSELTVGPDGRLYVLSDQSRRIARVEATLRPESDEKVSFDAAWKLPRKAEKPEGLVLAPGLVPVVAIDMPQGEEDLFVAKRLRD